MADVDINDLGVVGVVRDTPGYMLPPEAWTLAENVRYVDNGVERLKGHTQVLGTPGAAPLFLMGISTESQAWWLYMSSVKAWATDGISHQEVTRAAGDYTASAAKDINGTILGGIPIINNGLDVPQMWPSYALGTDLVALTNWPSTMRARVVRAFPPYLVAINISDSGVNKPHTLAWSHPADPGAVPISWDHTDPTKDAGRKDFSDVKSGILLDALPLRGTMQVYKESSIWRMVPIGGRFIFDFEPVSETVGLLATRCVALTGDGQKHFFASRDDIMVNDGQRVYSVVEQRLRKHIFNSIDSANFRNSFVFCNPLYNEMWFCYPESGNVQPNRALIWNYSHGGQLGAHSEATVDFVAVDEGTVETLDNETWANVTGTWEDDTEPWNISSRRKVVLVNPAKTKFFEMDSGDTRDGATFPASVQRIGLSIVGRNRRNEWIVDFAKRKQPTMLWPKVKGGPVNLRLGVQEEVDGSVAWSGPASFDPVTQLFVTPIDLSGKALSLEVSSTLPQWWRLDGYKMDLNVIGQF